MGEKVLCMPEDPENELVVGMMYGTRDPKNQIPNPDEFAFVIRGIDEDANELDVEYVLLNGTKHNHDRPEDTVPYDEYEEALHNRNSPFGWLQR